METGVYYAYTSSFHAYRLINAEQSFALLALAMAVDIPLLVLTWMEINGILASSLILGHTSLTTLP